MKKSLIIGIIITIILAIIFSVGIYLYRNNTANIKPSEDVKLADNANEINELVTTSLNEVKISPNAIIKYQTKYMQCGHVVEESQNVPEYMVNLNEAETKERCSNYEIKQFNADEVILYKEEEGICKEHYILRDYNGYIAIYRLESDGKETLQEITGIVTSYLPEIDIERLNIGIRVNGKQELNQLIEDFE